MTTMAINQQRMAARKNAQAKHKPFCAFCFDLGKSEICYTSHFVRETPALDSRIVCPELKACVCMGCGKCGHTIRNCKKTIHERKMGQDMNPCTDAPYKKRVGVNPKNLENIQPKNIYSIFSEDDNDSDLETENETIVTTQSGVSSVTTDNDMSARSYAAALLSILRPEPKPEVRVTPPAGQYNFTVFKNMKRYASWADAESSDDEM
jgi:Nanos RNA binding domain